MDDMDIFFRVVLVAAVIAAVIGLVVHASVYFFISVGYMVTLVGVVYLAHIANRR